MKEKLLEKIYNRDSSTRVFIINISADQYTDLFNDLDPDPLKRRDVDRNLEAYLYECSRDIPLKHGVMIKVIAPSAISNPEREKKVIAGLRTFLAFSLLSFNRNIMSLIKKSLVYIFSSFLLLGISFYFSSRIPDNIFLEILMEGLSIGGWVFLWEAIVILAIKSREVIIKRRQCKRLHEADIGFEYL
jgi:hypothetical protein